MKRPLVLVALASLLAAAVPQPVTAQTTRPQIGVQFQIDSYSSDTARLNVLNKLQAAGVTRIRMGVAWRSLETSNGVYNTAYLRKLDFAVDAAIARGIQVLAVLRSTPGWANGGREGNVPPTQAREYGDAALFVAKYFKGRVDAWEMWNEPNLTRFWTGTPTQLVGLFKAAYPKFKLGAPGVTVLAGGLAQNDDEYLRAMYAAGAKGYFDVLGIHPYTGPADAPPELPDDGNHWRFTHVAAMHDIMCSKGDCAKKIWFTEFGWSSHSNTGGEANFERGVTSQQQADYLVRAIEFTAANYPYVTMMSWFTDHNTTGNTVHLNNFGLLYADLTGKPAYFALKAYMGR